MLNPSVGLPQTTGKCLVLLREDALDAGLRALRESIGVNNIVRSSDFANNALTATQLESADAVVFDRLGVVVMTLNSEQLQSINVISHEANPILAVEPERVVYVTGDVQPMRLGQPIVSERSPSSDYLRGYRDAVVNLVDNVIATSGLQTENITYDELETSWDLQATRVINSPYSGRGTRIAVLDTGLDFTHPDFTGQQITGKSFVNSETAQDSNGHGTHVIGKACGSIRPTLPPRYGIAYNAEIYAGKVLSDRGIGSDSGILAGMEWAIANQCQIISMSLGSPALPGQRYSRVFETVARRALQSGTLVIAAAGNESDRNRGVIRPVAHPANCPSIMAVAAIDRNLAIAPFSNAGLTPSGGQIDIAAPGVDIYSSWLMPTQYIRISGTSMATPHVSGIAALYAEATGAIGQALWNQLTQSARRLPLSATDVGIGLVQAPIADK